MRQMRPCSVSRRNVDGAVGTHLYIDGTKGDVLGVDQLWQLHAAVTAALTSNFEQANAVRTKVIGNQPPLHFRGHRSATDDLQPAVLRAAGVQAAQPALGAG
jgi:hypothetical protein